MYKTGDCAHGWLQHCCDTDHKIPFDDCPYCEIDRLKGELEEVRAEENKQRQLWLDDSSKLIDRAEAAEKERDELKNNLDFAYQRAMVLVKMLGLEDAVHKSPAVTGTILGMVRAKVEKQKAQLSLYAGAVEVEGRVMHGNMVLVYGDEKPGPISHIDGQRVRVIILPENTTQPPKFDL